MTGHRKLHIANPESQAITAFGAAARATVASPAAPTIPRPRERAASASTACPLVLAGGSALGGAARAATLGLAPIVLAAFCTGPPGMRLPAGTSLIAEVLWMQLTLNGGAEVPPTGAGLKL